MSQFHPIKRLPQARYFYLPATNGKSAEIIQVLNCTTSSIQIPVPEEDIKLYSFFQRDMSEYEVAKFGGSTAWRIFSYWNQLEADHLECCVHPNVIALLLDHKGAKPLYEQHSAVA